MLTLAQILKKARLEKGLSLEEASRQSKIHKKYLEALEEGEYSLFSSEAHLLGFLKTYAQMLSLTNAGVLALLRREHGGKSLNPPALPPQPLDLPRFVLTPAAFFFLGVSLLLLFFIFFLWREYASLALSPELFVLEPVENLRMVEREVNVLGRTDPSAKLTLNGQEIQVAADGSFATTVSLSVGVNNLSFLAVNKLGKETQLRRSVIVESFLIKEEAVPPSPLALIVEVKVAPEAAWLRVEVDGEKVYEGILLSGLEKTFSGKQQIKIKTGNAGSTEIVWQGKRLGVLGKKGEVIERTFQKE